MLKSKKIIILVLSLIIFSSYSSAELSEDVVAKLIFNVDRAIEVHDAESLSNVLSNDVEITLHINMQGQSQTLTPSKQEYLQIINQSWAMYKNYTYSRSNLVIKILKDKAVVTADIRESMTIQGQQISGQSKEEVTVELVNGTALITKVIGHTAM